MIKLLPKLRKSRHYLTRAVLMIGLCCFQLQVALASGFDVEWQQTSTIVSGTVSDVDTGEPLVGATVVVDGTTNGTITDIDGNFRLEVPDPSGSSLSISSVGFKSQIIPIGNRTTFAIAMEIDVQALEEVVVVGYGTQKKGDLTGAISSISGDALNTAITANVDQALQGRLAGVQIAQNSGRPGAVASVRIRGTTSLTQSSEPLYVVDGVQISGAASSSAGFSWAGGAGGQTNNINPLSFLNPNDIESIDVLKDASATAIYGSRAANGVIIITTKRGKNGKGKFSYDGYYSVQEVYRTYDMMNLSEYAEYNNEVAQEVSTIQPNPRFADPSILGQGTDWQEAIFEVAPIQSHTITFSGGTDAAKFVLSGGYFSQDGIIINSGFDRLNLRVNVDSKVNEWLNVGTSMSLSRKDEQILLQDGGDGVVAQAAQMSPAVPVREFDGSFAGPATQNVSSQVTANPVGLALLRTNTALENRFFNNMYAEAKIIDGLTLRTELGTNYTNFNSTAFLPTYEWGQIVNTTSQLAEVANQNFFWLWKSYATYTKSFGEHDLTVLAGLEAQRSNWEGLTAYKVGLPNDIQTINQGDISNIPNTGFEGWSSIASEFTRVNYSFADRYLLTATLRRDRSSRFGPNRRVGVFPSASFAWRIMDEPFMPASSILSDLKLRVGWGQVGNQEIANYAFGSSLTALNSFFGSAVRNTRYSNRDVQWESTTATNLGLDIELFSGRVGIEAEAYNKQTNDLLLAINLPDIFGGQVGGPIANVGSMENRGLEFSVRTENFVQGPFKWSTSANLTLNRNEVKDLRETVFNDPIYWYSGFQSASTTREGLPVGQFFGFVVEGLFTSAEEISNHAVQIPSDSDPSVNKIDRTTGLWLGDLKFKDLNGDGVINNDDQTVIGDPNPDFTFGFNNSFEYKGLSLDVFLTGVIGGDILNYSRVRNEQLLNAFDNQSRAVLGRARTRLVEGGTDFNNINDVELVDVNATIPRFDNGAENNNHHMSTRWIEDGTYVRIQNIKLSYRIQTKWLDQIDVTNLLVYANVQNAATFTNYSGLDPQIGNFNQNPRIRNVDLGRFPTPRVFTMGLKLDF